MGCGNIILGSRKKWIDKQIRFCKSMGHLHVSLMSRISIKGSPRKNFLKMGSQNKKFEKPCFRETQPISRATIPSLFLRFVLILRYYVLENINVLISKKCPYLWLASLFFLIFCSITILNKQYLIDIETISISS